MGTLNSAPLASNPQDEEDHRVVVHHVGREPDGLVDLAVERIAERQRIDVARARANAARQCLVVAGEALDLRRMVRSNHEEELERHAALLALGQHKSGREATVRLGHVERELVVPVVRLHHLLVQLEVGRAVLHEPAKVLRVARDRILARHQIHQEVVELEEVLAVGVHAVQVAVLVVLRAEEHQYHRLLRLVRHHIQLEREGQMVETGHARVQHKVLALWAILPNFFISPAFIVVSSNTSTSTAFVMSASKLSKYVTSLSISTVSTFTPGKLISSYL
uniref:Uncharacterized protein n=1 Tax=Anopheles epiroticus TaxID=199890 RepID=A0A182PGJ3_9DIPT